MTAEEKKKLVEDAEWRKDPSNWQPEKINCLHLKRTGPYLRISSNFTFYVWYLKYKDSVNNRIYNTFVLSKW